MVKVGMAQAILNTRQTAAKSSPESVNSRGLMSALKRIDRLA